MGTVVVHAGMPKAGSSSIQAWLTASVDELRARDIELLVATDRGRTSVEVVPYEGGGVVSGAFLYGYLGFDRDPEILARFLAGIDRAAAAHATSVITAEGFANLFTPLDHQFVSGLQRLAQDHEVRVAYYVRPQHTSMEAAWCQWGYRLPDPPSTYLSRWAETLDYRSTLDDVRRAAPDVSFEVRPFRSDLLLHGDVVADFADHFLGMEASPASERANLGFSLDLVNILRGAPTGLLWDSAHDNRHLDLLRPALTGLELQPSPDVVRSRAVLRAHCHQRFEADDLALLRSLGWDTTSFVPAPDPGQPTGSDPADLAELDELWSLPSAETTRAVLLAVLAGLTPDR